MTHRASAFMSLVLCSYIVGCGSSNTANSPSDGSIPAGYTDLCNINAVNCPVGASPLDMGTYTGTGTTTVTSNETWRVGDSDSFKAVIATHYGAVTPCGAVRDVAQ